MNYYRPARWALALALPLIAGLARAQERSPAATAPSASGCPVATPAQPPPPATSTSAPRPQIFVETVVLELRGGAADMVSRMAPALMQVVLPSSAVDPLALRGPELPAAVVPTGADTLTLPGGPPAVRLVEALRQRGATTVLWTPNVLVTEGARAGIALPREPPADVGLRCEIRAQMNPQGELRLDVSEDVSSRTGGHAMSRTVVVLRDDQTMVLPGPRVDEPTQPGPPRTLALIVTPHVIRSPADLHALFERRMRERQEALDRYLVFSGANDAAPHADYAHTRGLLGELREQLRAR